MTWLSPVNYVSQQSDIIGRRQEGTGQWFLDATEFRTWVRQPKKTLFCPGMPGAGKTMIAAIATDYLLREMQNNSTGVAFVYCNYKSHEEQNVTKLLAAILRQLVQAQPSLIGLIEGLKRDNPNPTSDKIFQTMRSALAEHSIVYIVIDAIDELETDNSTRRKVIDCLRDLQTGIDLRLMVTSRDLPDIIEKFDETLTLEVRATEKDVKRFVAGRIDGLPRCIQRDKVLQERVQEEIAKAVDGMYVCCPLGGVGLDL